MLVGFDSFDDTLNESSVPAETLMKATAVSYLDAAVANEVTRSTFDEVRGVAIWAEKTRPVVFGSIVAEQVGWTRGHRLGNAR